MAGGSTKERFGFCPDLTPRQCRTSNIGDRYQCWFNGTSDLLRDSLAPLPKSVFGTGDSESLLSFHGFHPLLDIFIFNASSSSATYAPVVPSENVTIMPSSPSIARSSVSVSVKNMAVALPFFRSANLCNFAQFASIRHYLPSEAYLGQELRYLRRMNGHLGGNLF